MNSHVTFNKYYYSVPYAYIGKTVTLKIYATRVAIYDKGKLLCSHPTERTIPGAYTTNEEHLPVDSMNFGKWNSAHYLSWAQRIGLNVHTVVQRLFEQGPEQQYYRRAHSLLNLADSYSDQRLDKTCQYALERVKHPGYSLVKQFIESPPSQFESSTDTTSEQSYLRGASYYDRFNQKD